MFVFPACSQLTTCIMWNIEVGLCRSVNQVRGLNLGGSWTAAILRDHSSSIMCYLFPLASVASWGVGERDFIFRTVNSVVYALYCKLSLSTVNTQPDSLNTDDPVFPNQWLLEEGPKKILMNLFLCLDTQMF